MRLLGMGCTLGGWLVAIAGLFISASVGARVVFICLGIAVSLYGSLGLLNGYYLERAVWKK